MSPGTIAPSSKCEINFFRLQIATAVLISFAWFSICCCKLGNWTLIESENGEIFFFFSIWSVQRMFCCLLLHKYGTDYQKPIRVYKGKFWVWHQDSLLLNRDKLEIQCLSSHHNAQCFPREIIWKEPSEMQTKPLILKKPPPLIIAEMKLNRLLLTLVIK